MTLESDAPPLSVIIPLFNGARFIGETLDSLAAQTIQLREVIVVDDGSSDDGVAQARSHAVRPRILLQSHGGVATARNRGALAAEGQFIAFLDQDDLWLPCRHERILAFLARHPECRAVVTTERSFFLAADRAELEALGEGLHRGADFRDVENSDSLLREIESSVDSPRVTRTFTTHDLLQGPVMVTTSYFVERELYFLAGGSTTLIRSIDDYLALLSISRFAPIPLLDEPSVLYRIHPASASMTTARALPLLAAQSAVRYGGNLVPVGRARDSDLVGSLSLFWRHQLLTLARSGSAGLLDAVAFTQLLASSGRERIRLRVMLLKARARAWRNRTGSHGWR